jgi:hypothetical protein
MEALMSEPFGPVTRDGEESEAGRRTAPALVGERHDRRCLLELFVYLLNAT